MSVGVQERAATSPQPTRAAQESVVTVTAVIALGLVLTTLPLRAVFTDWTWLVTTLACAAPYWLVVGFFRTRSAPLWWHSVVGLLGSGLVVVWIFVPQNLALGLVPTPASAGDVNTLISQARHALQVEHAPIASTAALRFMTSGLLTLLAALTDILGVGLRRPLLAGAPMLEILAVSSTTSSKAASPVWFIAAALGFLLILLAGTRLQDQSWGPAVDGSMGRLGGARSIAAAAIVAALLIPAVLPGRSGNVLAKATHHSSSGGAGGQTVLNDLASLRGSLKRGTPTDLFKVTVTGNGKPFYIRQAVLDTFDNTGWLPSPTTDQRQLSPLSTASFTTLPTTSGKSGLVALKAEFTTLGLGGQNLPILGNPVSLQNGLRGQWDARTATVVGANVKRNLKYTETVIQPAPTTQQLLDAPAADDPALAADVKLPVQPPAVRQLAESLTAGKATPYEKALAISSYFTDGKNGFVYSLNAPADDGRQAIVTFLEKKQGYCQQYAAAAAVLMRAAGLPSRVVIGYTHPAPDVTGSFTVSTLDAHAWVEAYFPGVGWTPFDPTPLTGADAAREVTLPYAQHGTDGVVATGPTTGASSGPSAQVTAPKAVPRQLGDDPAGTSQAATKHSGTPVGWIVAGVAVLVLAALLASPALLRGQLRRRRVARARRAGTAEPLWQELAAAARDRDALWPDTLTVAQVPGWLGGHGLDERGALAVRAVAERVQSDRYATPDAASAAMPDESQIAGFEQALRRWGRRAERRQRLLSTWLPRSLFTRQTSMRR